MISAMNQPPQVIVVGGGHAGAEAAAAAARMGVSTILLTMTRGAIGRMSCNPAMGGIAKGQIIREIDALGGLMGLATDAGGIQFRVLNRRKGPAVWAPRAQCDRGLYAEALTRLLDQTPNLTILEGLVEDLLVQPCPVDDRPAVRGVRLADGREIPARAVVLTTGTFLRGVLHTGEQTCRGGRLGEPAADALSGALERLGLRLARLKTGTPPRVARDSVDYSVLEEQPGDERPTPFSFLNERLTQPQVPCWITYTNERTHELIRASLHRAPLYTGQITSTGPRYCPSIETKIVRFADKARHQLFLEPEGYDSDRLYCNGISTSLPPDVQEQMVRSIVGLEKARIVQMGYAIEYDYVPPQQTLPTLESKLVKNLFLAGQINGTSGYEEAAGQGLLAGVNAAAQVLERPPLVLRRDQAYIGVMIDDLVTKGTVEPYRMFTSRAEFRLLLRSDNADARLTPIGREFGLVDDRRWERFRHKAELIQALTTWATSEPNIGKQVTEWWEQTDGETAPWPGSPLRRGFLNALRDHALHSPSPALVEEAMLAAGILLKYDGYIRRQEREVERFRRMEVRSIPETFDFAKIRQLRLEAREKLAQVRPRTVGQAQRIDGISPADIAVLLLHLELMHRGSGRNPVSS